jgi:hypothetical protein
MLVRNRGGILVRTHSPEEPGVKYRRREAPGAGWTLTAGILVGVRRDHTLAVVCGERTGECLPTGIRQKRPRSTTTFIRNFEGREGGSDIVKY